VALDKNEVVVKAQAGGRVAVPLLVGGRVAASLSVGRVAAPLFVGGACLPDRQGQAGERVRQLALPMTLFGFAQSSCYLQIFFDFNHNSVVICDADCDDRFELSAKTGIVAPAESVNRLI
jgi:hypothetical protein